MLVTSEENKKAAEYAYKKFRKILDERNMSDYQFSKLTEGEISTALLSQWGKGDYTLKLSKLRVIARALDVSIHEFIMD